jgi:hypothetical protein
VKVKKGDVYELGNRVLLMDREGVIEGGDLLTRMCFLIVVAIWCKGESERGSGEVKKESCE